MRRYENLMATMLLGGLWHGAGWSFVVWGGLHGCYLAVNHAWQTVGQRMGFGRVGPATMRRLVSLLVTFLCVVVAWVFFRAKDIDSAMRVLRGMFDVYGVVLPEQTVVSEWLVGQLPGLQMGNLVAFGGDRQIAWTLSLLVLALGAPNTQEVVERLRRQHWPARLPSAEISSLAVGAMFFWVLVLLMINETRGVSEFIYFNF